MPTPSETTLPPSPPSELPSRASFASCPPEEDRDSHSSEEERLEDATTRPSAAAAEADIVEEHAMIAQEPTPEPETQAGASAITEESETNTKSDDARGVGTSSDSPSPVAAHPESTGGDDEGRTAQVTSDDVEAALPAPQYLSLGPDNRRRHPNTTSSFLRPGSKFKGTQQSDRQVYEVQVEIKDVDMAESFLCGYLRIKGLTDDHPTLTTFFEGEIIGPKHLFRTTNPSWGSSEKVDLQHWARFPAWRPLAKSVKSPNFTLKNFAQREHLFMRWKEYFLVPDHRVKTITGASFEGFYYICFNQCSGHVSGIYFHSKSEKYQQLELEHVDDRGCMGAMEFR